MFFEVFLFRAQQRFKVMVVLSLSITVAYSEWLNLKYLTSFIRKKISNSGGHTFTLLVQK